MPKKSDSANIITEFDSGKLKIKNIELASATDYTVSLRVGYKASGALPTDILNGFGYVVLLKGTTVLFKSKALMRNLFNVVADNKFMNIGEIVIKDNIGNRANRGFSSYRSDLPINLSGSLLTKYSNYKVTVSKNGLRVADDQYFWFQSSIGPNPLYYSGATINPNHDSEKTFIEILTNPQVTSDNPNVNCAFFNAAQNLFTDAIDGTSFSGGDKAKLQAFVDSPNVIKNDVGAGADAYSYIFNYGCTVANVTMSDIAVSRLRMRLKDFRYRENTSDQWQYLRTVRMAFTDATELSNVNTRSTPGVQMENLFIWQNIDIKGFHDFYIKDIDSIV